MPNPEASTGREAAPEAAELSPQEQTEREVERTEREIQDAGPDRVRENLEQEWSRGENGGVRYLAKNVDGKWYRLYEDGRVFRQGEGRTLKKVSPSQYRTLPAVVQQKINFLDSRWKRGEERGKRYVEINLPGEVVYRIAEGGQVLLREGEGAFRYIAAGEQLPVVVQGKLREVEAYERWQRQERLGNLEGEDLDRALDIEEAERTLSALRSVRVEFLGRAESVEGWPEDGEHLFRLLSRHSVRPDRYNEYVQNVRRSAENMGKTVAEKYGEQWQGAMRWNTELARLECEAEAGSPFEGEKLVALATGTLRQPSNSDRTDASGNEKFWTLRDEQHPDIHEVTRLTDSASYAVYRHELQGGEQKDYMATDGSIRYRKSRDAIQVFDDNSSTRPASVAVMRDGTQVSFTETADPNSPLVTRTMNRGNHVLDQLGGEPVRDFKDFKMHVEQGEIQVAEGQDIREAYADHIARNLHSPEAISNFVTRFVGLNESYETQRDQNGHARMDPAVTVDWMPDAGVDVQHPLVTLERGEGDCEDFALLFQYLLEKSGTSSMAVRLAFNHFGCVHFEERYVEQGGRMEKRYDFVLLDNVRGYTNSRGRIPDGFASPEDALRKVVHEDMTSYLHNLETRYGHLERRAPSSLSEREQSIVRYLQEMRDTYNNGGGVETIRPPQDVLAMGDSSSTRGRSGYMGYKEDLSQYIRRDRDAREETRRTVRAERPAPQRRSETGRTPAREAAAARNERAATNPRIASEQAKIREAQQYPRNQWRALRTGQAGYQYFMDNEGHLFASRDPSNQALGYQYLNVNNSYTWEQRAYNLPQQRNDVYGTQGGYTYNPPQQRGWGRRRWRG